MGNTKYGEMVGTQLISEVNGFDIDFYDPVQFLNFNVNTLNASVSQDLYKYMFTGHKNLIGQYTDFNMGFSVLYMIDPSQSVKQGSWTADGHIDFDIRIYRVKVLYDIELIQASSQAVSGVETIDVIDSMFYVRHNASGEYLSKTFLWSGTYLDWKYEWTDESNQVTKMGNQTEEKLYFKGYYIIKGKGIRGLRGY